MDQRATDKLLGELFKRNAPSIDEPALRERITAKLVRRRRRSRRNRAVRAVALGFACLVLASAAAFGAYQAVDHFRSPAQLVFTDLMPSQRDAAAGWGADDPFGLARVSPVMGTAVLEQVKNEGMRDPEIGEGGARWTRGRVEAYRLSMSQPAVDGTMETIFDLGTYLDGSGSVQGSWVLRTDQGTWEGSFWQGILTADGADQFYIGRAAGTGGLEGLLLVLEWHALRNPGSSPTAEASAEPIAISGWIQPAE